MLQFRTPLLSFHLLASILLVAGLLGVAEVFGPNRFDIESWRSGASPIPTATILLFLFGLLGFVATFGMEIALIRGWEPEWLERVWTGVTVQGFEKEGRQTWVVVRAGHEVHEFLADDSEAAGLRAGDLIHLRTIGKYVSRYNLVEEGHFYIPPKGLSFVSQHPLTGAIVLLFFVGLVGFLLWFGLYGLLSSDVAFSTGRRFRARRQALISGQELKILATISLVTAVALWVLITVSLRKGVSLESTDE